MIIKAKDNLSYISSIAPHFTMILRVDQLLFAFLCLSRGFVSAWVLPLQQPSKKATMSTTTSCMMASLDEDSLPQASRRQMLQGMAIASWALLLSPQPSQALVKGNAPPSKQKPSGDKPKCVNLEECQEQAEKRAQELRESEESGPPPMVTSSGMRYKDMEDGSGPKVKLGDEVKLYYKVLKGGKRSYDGISGEGTVVFSRGTQRTRVVSFGIE
jgi:hypothetical protein